MDRDMDKDMNKDLDIDRDTDKYINMGTAMDNFEYDQ